MHSHNLIQEFLNDNPDWTEVTCDWYRRRLKDFVEFLRDQRKIDNLATVQPPDINAYLGRLRRQKLAYTTRYGSYTIIQAWFRWLWRRRKIPANPFNDPDSGLRRPRKVRRRTRPVTIDHMRQMLQAARLCEADIAVRDLAIMLLLATTGMRRQELVAITLLDVDFQAETIYVTGKGEHQRKVKLVPLASRSLQAWLKIRPDTQEPVIFISMHTSKKGLHHGLQPDAVNDRLIHWRDQAGLPRISVSPHKWRHAFASFISRSSNIFALQELLGHTDISTTRLYVHTSDEELRDLVDRFGPDLE